MLQSQKEWEGTGEVMLNQKILQAGEVACHIPGQKETCHNP